MNDKNFHLEWISDFPEMLEDMVDTFNYAFSDDSEAMELKDRLHTLRWDVHEWLKKKWK